MLLNETTHTLVDPAIMHLHTTRFPCLIIVRKISEGLNYNIFVIHLSVLN